LDGPGIRRADWLEDQHAGRQSRCAPDLEQERPRDTPPADWLDIEQASRRAAGIH